MNARKVNLRNIVALLATALILMSLLAAPAPVLAGDDEVGRGLFVGVNAGFGGSKVEYQDSSKSILEDPTPGAYGALRFGYAFSRKLALSIESHGFGGTRDRDEDWGVGATVLALTWHPGGKGFYIRGGIGGGGGEFIHPDTDELITIRDRFAALCGLGYDWWLSESTTLGVAFDAIDIDAGGATGFDDDRVGAGGVSLQFNWYL